MITYSAIYWDHPELHNKIYPMLSRDGGVLVADSDTVCGLFTFPSQAGFDTLNRIKGRSNNPYLMIIGKINILKYFIDFHLYCKIENFIIQIWPGPLTLVFRAKSTLPPFMVSQRGTIAFRIPNHGGLQDLLRHFSVLFSTSANKAGCSTPASVHEVCPEILKEGKYFIANREKNHNHIPSTILDCTNANIKVIREGAYSIRALEAIHGTAFDC